MSTTSILFTVEEALTRLGQTKGQGCLLVFSAKESIHLFVKDGAVISAVAGAQKGEEVITAALDMKEAAYRWIPDAEPTEQTAPIDIRDYILRRTQGPDTRFKTIKMATYQRKEKKLDFQYFLVPEETPNLKLRLKKTASVVGRERSCDIHVESFQVSRRHCLLEITDRGLLMKDLDSTNGTFLNGVPVKDGFVADGDRLSLGTYVLTLRREKI
jgi:hypothetical protein